MSPPDFMSSRYFRLLDAAVSLGETGSTEESHSHNSQLNGESQKDPLTGLFNQGYYSRFFVESHKLGSGGNLFHESDVFYET